MARCHTPDVHLDGGIPARQSVEEGATARPQQVVRPRRLFVASLAAVLLASLAPIAALNAATVTGTGAVTFSAGRAGMAAVVGPPAQLVFLAPPSSAAAGSPFSPDIQVAIEDVFGNIVTNGITATVRLAMGTNPIGGVLTCNGGFDQATVAGVATFPGCSIDAEAEGYTLLATAVSTSSVVSLVLAQTGPFDVGPAAAVLSITSSSSVITWGNGITLHVQFAGGAGESVTFENSRDHATWQAIGTVPIDDAGDGSFVYRPFDNRYYRATFAGSSEISPGLSPSVRVVVRQIALMRPTNSGHTRTVSVGTVVSFTVTVRPARPDLTPATVTYVVYQLVGTHWIQIVTRDLVANAAGQTRLTLTYTQPGNFYVRAIALPTIYNANSSWSPIERYYVR